MQNEPPFRGSYGFPRAGSSKNGIGENEREREDDEHTERRHRTKRGTPEEGKRQDERRGKRSEAEPGQCSSSLHPRSLQASCVAAARH